MSDCIEWHKSRTKTGYGKQWWKGKLRRAHRVSYANANGLDIDDLDGLVVRHSCDNPACINPEHLEVGTQQDNLSDMSKRRRSTHGEKSRSAKLAVEQVETIRRRYVFRCPKNGGRALAAEFGVCEATISHLVRGDTWA